MYSTIPSQLIYSHAAFVFAFYHNHTAVCATPVLGHAECWTSVSAKINMFTKESTFNYLFQEKYTY
jgi:hypothetical protein